MGLLSRSDPAAVLLERRSHNLREITSAHVPVVTTPTSILGKLDLANPPKNGSIGT